MNQAAVMGGPGGLSYAQLGPGFSLQVGQILTKPGSPHIMRVLREGNWVEQFTGNRKQRALVLNVWRVRDQRLRDAMWKIMLGGGWLSPYAQLEPNALAKLRALASRRPLTG